MAYAQNGITFGVAEYKTSDGELYAYEIYALFNKNPVYRLYPEYVAENGKTNLSMTEKLLIHDYKYPVNIFEDNYNWETQFIA